MTRSPKPARRGPAKSRPAAKRAEPWTDDADAWIGHADAYVLRWQDGPWVGRYPLNAPPDEEADGKVAHGPPSPGRGRARPKRRPG